MDTSPPPPINRFYDDLAHWWPLFSAPADYAEEAAFYLNTLRNACARPLCTLLEIGSGGGNNAYHMKPGLSVTLVEPSYGMRAVSQRLNPDCEHLPGDMRTLRLGRVFDAVFIHDALCYMTTEADLRAAIETAFLHCAPGGAALFAPDFVRENFRPGTDDGGEDGPDGRGLRYLEWMVDPDPSDTTYVVDYAFMLREGDRVDVVHDRHIEGLFPHALWMRLIEEVGFIPSSIRFEHSEVKDLGLFVFDGRRPG
jgi:SAM-dependent methyltransferase